MCSCSQCPGAFNGFSCLSYVWPTRLHIWRHAVDVLSEVLTKLSPFEPLQFRSRLPAAGGLDPQAVAELLVIRTSDLTVWDCVRKEEYAEVFHAFRDLFSRPLWKFTWHPDFKRAERSLSAHLSSDICLWPFRGRGRRCFFCFAASEWGDFTPRACVTKSCSEPLTCETPALNQQQLKGDPAAETPSSVS